MAGYLRSRVAYLQGLAEGLDIHKDPAQGRVMTELLDVLEEVAGVVEGVEERIDEVEEYIQAVDEDLDELEDEVTAEPVVFEADEDDDLCCPGCGQSLLPDVGAVAGGQPDAADQHAASPT